MQSVFFFYMDCLDISATRFFHHVLYIFQLDGAMFENRIIRGQKDYSFLHDQKLILWNNRLTNLINQVTTYTYIDNYQLPIFQCLV